MGWMCDLAVELHQATGDTLAGAAASAGRRQLSEEHVTYKLLDLIDGFAAHGAPIWIRDYGRSDESANGADLELWFWGRGDGMAVGWLVQAKRLSPPETAASAPKFKSIRHKVGGKLQSDLLIETAAKVNGLMPLYWLYSWDLPARTRCSRDPSCKCTPSTFDEALIVMHAETLKASTGSSWHSVVENNITLVESLRRLWCNGGNSVQLLSALMRDLLPGGVAEPDRMRSVVERPPGYVLALMQSQEELQGAERGTTARRLVLIVL